MKKTDQLEDKKWDGDKNDEGKVVEEKN